MGSVQITRERFRLPTDAGQAALESTSSTVVSSALSLSMRQDVTATEIYEDHDYGWQVQFPQTGWTEIVALHNESVRDEVVIKRRVSFIGPAHAEINIDVREDVSGLSLSQWFERYEKLLVSQRAQIPAGPNATVAGQDAVFAVEPANPPAPARLITVLQYRQEVFRLEYVAFDGGLSQDTYRQMLLSFKLTGMGETVSIVPEMPLKAQIGMQPLEAGCCGYTSSSNPFSCFGCGNCVWWGRYKRPDLTECTGSAYLWRDQARSANYPTGSTPQVGAIVVFQPGIQDADLENGHVAYVEEVLGTSTFRVSEMSYPNGCMNVCCQVCTSRTFHTEQGVDFIYAGGCGACNPPAAPSNIGVSCTGWGSVRVTWKDNSSDEDYFQIFRNGAPIPICLLRNSVSYDDSDLDPGVYYSYYVEAHKINNCESAASNTSGGQSSLLSDPKLAAYDCGSAASNTAGVWTTPPPGPTDHADACAQSAAAAVEAATCPTILTTPGPRSRPRSGIPACGPATMMPRCTGTSPTQSAAASYNTRPTSGQTRTAWAMTPATSCGREGSSPSRKSTWGQLPAAARSTCGYRRPTLAAATFAPAIMGAAIPTGAPCSPTCSTRATRSTPPRPPTRGASPTGSGRPTTTRRSCGTCPRIRAAPGSGSSTSISARTRTRSPIIRTRSTPPITTWARCRPAARTTCGSTRRITLAIAPASTAPRTTGNGRRSPPTASTTSPPANPTSAAESHGTQDGQSSDLDSPTFTWARPDDGGCSGVAAYRVYFGQDPNGTSDSSVTNEVYSPVPLTVEGTYYLRVKTQDVAGNLAADWQTVFTYVFAKPHAPTCWAMINSAPEVYRAVQAAVDAAVTEDVVKVAGYCAGVESRNGVTQTVFINKSITLRGGYTTTNWIEADSFANPTTLDAWGRDECSTLPETYNPRSRIYVWLADTRRVWAAARQGLTPAEESMLCRLGPRLAATRSRTT